MRRADLSPADDAPDCLTIGDVNQQALFERVAAVVHPGGAGTTTDSLTAALERTLRPEVAARARAVAATVRSDGARVAAESLITTHSRAVVATS